MPRTADPPVLSGTDRLTPRVVFFGPPHAGKSSLIRAFLAAAAPPGRDIEVFAPNDTPGGLQRELVPHLIRFADPAGPTGTVVVCDCDGRAAHDLLSHPSSLVRGTARGALTGAVRSADALVLVVDAAATPDDVDATFRAFGEFLGSLEEGRTFGREVGGLPVFLTLTKCDVLYRAGDDPTDWLARVEARKGEVESRFEDYFGDAVADAGSWYLPFGSIDLHLAATAVHTPNPPAFEAYSDPDGSFGVADLADEVLPAARAYRARLLRARQRLRVTLAGVGGLVGLMLLGLVGLVAAGWAVADPLVARVRAVQSLEGPAAVRLSDRNLPRNRRELAAIRESPRFDSLPADLRAFVDDRLTEYEAYREYRAKFQPPRLGPADVRTREELVQLDAALAGELAPLPGYAAAWADTEAARLRAKWQTDAALLGEAEGRVYDWYRGLVRRANQLLLAEEPPDAGWRGRVGGAVAAENDPPFRPADKVPGSPIVAVRRGAALTYAPAFEFDRIDQARRDWADARDRLLALRDLSDALGLTAGEGRGSTPPSAVLDLPEPGAGVDSLNLASARLKALSDAFPKRPLKHPEWSPDDFPDPARRWLEPRIRASFDAGVRHVRGLIRSRLGADRPDAWKRLAEGFLTEPAVRDWGTLLGLLRRWADPAAPAADPVQELAAFVKLDHFDLTLKAFDVSIPDDLLGDRLVPAGPLTVRFTPAGGSPVELAFRQDGDGRRERPLTAYRFVPDGHPGGITYRPGDGFTASLPLRSGGREYRLVWSAPRSVVYQFDALAQPPVLEKVGPIPAPERVPGVKVESGLPAVPVLGPAW